MLFCGWDKLIHGGRVAYNAGSQRRNRDVTAGKNRRATSRGRLFPERRREFLGRAAGFARQQRACRSPREKVQRRHRAGGPCGQHQPHGFRFRGVTRRSDSRDLSSAGCPAANGSPFPGGRCAGRCARFPSFRNAFRGPRRDGDHNTAAAFASLGPYKRGGDGRCSANFRFKHRDPCGQQHRGTNVRFQCRHHQQPCAASFGSELHEPAERQRHSASFRFNCPSHRRPKHCDTNSRFQRHRPCGPSGHHTGF